MRTQYLDPNLRLYRSQPLVATRVRDRRQWRAKIEIKQSVDDQPPMRGSPS